MMGTILCTVLLLLGIAHPADVQPAGTSPSDPPSYAYQHWTVEEGLPVNTVRDLAQGPQGYLWMVTYDGLVRFDGVRFAAMRTVNSALPTNRLYRFRLGPEDDLWVETGDGRIVRVDPVHQVVLETYGRGEQGVRGAVNRFAQTGDTRWLATTKMLYRGSAGNTGWRPVLPDTMNVGAMNVGPRGVWVGTARRGLWRVRGSTAEHVAVTTPHGRRPRDIRSLVVRPLRPDGEGTRTVWMGGSNGIFRLHEDRLRPFQPGGHPWTQQTPVLNGTPDGTLWICTWTGKLYTTRGREVQRQGHCAPAATNELVRTHVQNTRWVLRQRRVTRNGQTVLRAGGDLRDILVDREGNRWVATARDGLYRVRRTPVTMMDTAEGLPSTNVYGILRDRSTPRTLWATSIHGGLVRIEAGPPVEVTRLTDRWGLPGIVWTIGTAPDGTHWIGAPQGLFRRTDGPATQEDLPKPLRQHPVRAVVRDRADRLWTMVDGALYVHEGGTWKLHTDGVADGASGRVIVQARTGSLWMGTDTGGLVRVRGDTVETVTTDDGLGSNRIRSIYEDEDGILWVGTEDRGLTRIDRRGTLSMDDDIFTTITRQDGLPDNVISQILPDDHGRLWLSTNRGIFWVRRDRLDAYARGHSERLRPVLYTEADGLNSREANGGVHSAGTRTADGRLWFPTQEGIAVIDPGAVQTAPPPPSVIERVAAQDTTYAVHADTSLRLRADERTFTVRYAGLHFANPTATQFRVQLEGIDASPAHTGRRTVRYTNVGPGTYTLHVQAVGQHGTWGPPSTLTLTVPPFWWETGWFYALCGLGLLGLGLAAYRWRVGRLRRRQEELEQTVTARTEEVRAQKAQIEAQAERLEELDAAKSRFFANISHEFRTPLTLILGPVRDLRERVRQSLSDTDAERLNVVDRNARRLLRLVNQILGLARLDAGTYDLDAHPTALDREVERIAQTFAPLAERKDLTLEVETASVPPEAAPVHVDREALEHILSNLLSNAIKFTPDGGRVVVTTTETSDAAEIAVADTGPGIPASEQDAVFDRFQQLDDSSTREEEGTGIGLAFAKDLVELHGGTVMLDSSEGEGTMIRVRFVRGAGHLAEEQLGERPSGDGAENTGPEGGGIQGSLDVQTAPDTTGSPDAADGPDDPSAAQSQSKIVLIVDDNADVRRYVRSILEPECAVVEAGGGEKGLQVAREQLPDVILADVMMPGMDGMQMVRRLTDDPETKGIPVIMVTARADAADEVEGLEAGADDYVTKPFDAEVLRQRVEGVIALQERLRQRLREQIQAEVADRASTEDDTTDRPEIEQEARQVIREHLTESTFDVEALARAMGVSRATLYRRFDAATDLTPAALVTRVRIEQAKDLLRDGEGTITQVAYAVGFEQLSSFSRAFREEVGQSPSALASDEA